MHFFRYEDSVLSVLAALDDDGNLSSTDAARLLDDHGFTFQDLEADNHEVSWCHLAARNGAALLAWLGY